MRSHIHLEQDEKCPLATNEPVGANWLGDNHRYAPMSPYKLYKNPSKIGLDHKRYDPSPF